MEWDPLRRTALTLVCCAPVVAVVGSTVLCGVASAQTPAPSEPAVEYVRWHLVGTGPDGRSLLIHQLRKGYCGFDAPLTPTVEASSDRIIVRIEDVPRPPEPESPDGAPPACPDVIAVPTITTVPIGRRVSGQTIGGEGRVAASDQWNWASVSMSVPRLVGLRIPDAIAVLRDAGIAKSRVRFDGPRRGRVVGQTPAGKKPLAKSGRVVLRTQATASPR